ncbi:MAG TPA: TetR/AcrR family transcriptional regulator [Gaiellaceae bacterium]|nr:TetR/AcrR family transcriptional regulator [Gaiellaceae bacterium]
MPKVTEEHVEARRRQILSAALRSFARDGFHRTTMQDIFREADLSPGAVYSYFEGKDELIRAIIGEMMSFVEETAELFREPLPEGRLRRPAEALVEMIERYQEFELGTVEERARIFPHLVGEQQRDPMLNAAVRAGINRLREGFEMLARAAQERGELDLALEPEHYSRVTISMLQGLLLQLGVFGEEIDIDGYAEAATELLDRPPSR